jgi:integrase
MKYFSFFTSKRDAEQQLMELEKRIAKGEVAFAEQETSQVVGPNGKDLRVEELAHLHLASVLQNRSRLTFENRKLYVLKFLEFMGAAMVSEITRLKLDQFYAWVKQDSSKPNAGYEAMRNVRTLLKWGEDEEVVDLQFKRFPKLSYVQPETRRVDAGELGMLLAHASPDFKDYIMFGLFTGLRPFEMRTLQQDHVRHDGHGVSYIFIEKNVKGAKMARTPKPRSVPLCKEAEAIIERQIMAHPQSPLIFLNEDGTPYTRFTLRDRFRRLVKVCGLDHRVVPYGLRHTFASLQALGGTETTSLAQLMGHSSTRTLQRYVSNTAREHKEAMDRNEKRLMTILGEAERSATKISKKLSPELSPEKVAKGENE